MSNILTIADRVVAELNDEDRPWFGDFTATRRYQPYLQAEELEDLTVSVMLRRYDAVPISRANAEREYDIQVVVQRIFDESTADDIIELAEGIALYFEGKVFDGYPCRRASLDPIYSTEHVSNRIITSVVILTFTNRS